MAKNVVVLACMSMQAAIPCSAAIITVDWDGSADYTTIQAGINAAVSGIDTVVVAEGTYVENISIGGKDIILTSSDPDDPNVVVATIIDGNDLDSVVRFDGTETSVCKLTGFTITNGYGYADGDGGGIDGDFLLGPRTQATIANCIIRDNVAQRHGGGIRGHNGLIDRCIITGNSTVNRNGGGMFNFFTSTTVTNCILWGNTAAYSGNEILDQFSTPAISYSDIAGGYPGTGNIDADPLFVDADGADDITGTEDDNLRLLCSSPCIDAGDNGAVPLGIITGLDGLPRFIDDSTVDTGTGTPPIVDMGAFELFRSDIDSNGRVNLKDFSQLALYWLDMACGDCGGADLTCDSNVSVDDLQKLAFHWLEGT